MNNFFYLSSNHESSLRKNHVLESSDIEMNPGPGPEAVQRTESVTMTPTRPELASGQSSSVKLKFHNYCPFEDNLRDNSDLSQTWSAPVLQCFRKCKSAIECIYNVDSIFYESGFVSGKTNYLFKVEDSIFRTAAYQNCTDGVIYVTVFKFSDICSNYYYVRYIESGMYVDFMSLHGRSILSHHLNCDPANIILFKVFNTGVNRSSLPFQKR